MNHCFYILESGFYVCSRCQINTRRNRLQWIRHFKACDPDEYELALNSLRAVNDALKSINDNSSNQVIQSDFFEVLE